MHVLFSLEPGGLENGVVNLSNGLDPASVRTSVCCLEIAGRFAARLLPSVRVFALGRRPRFDLRAVWRLARLIRREKPDLLHTHNLGPLLYAVLARRVALSRVPILHGEHGALQGDDLDPRRLVQRRRYYRSCRKVHTVSASLAAHLVEMGFDRDRITSVVNGVDCGRFEPPGDKAAAKEAVGLPATAPVVGCVGRFIPTKRHILLLDAFDRLAARHPALHLVLLGDGGSEQEAVRARSASSPFRDRIRFEGFRADPRAHYQAMDLLAVPSSHEGLSNVVLEAMACGVPCLTNLACGAAEVVDHGVDGIARELPDLDALERALEEALGDPVRLARLGAAARAKAVDRLSLPGMVANYERLYRACLERA